VKGACLTARPPGPKAVAYYPSPLLMHSSCVQHQVTWCSSSSGAIDSSGAVAYLKRIWTGEVALTTYTVSSDAVAGKAVTGRRIFPICRRYDATATVSAQPDGAFRAHTAIKIPGCFAP
jgi:hypothetical protein